MTGETSRTAAIVGFLLAGGIILALGFLRGGPDDEPTGAPPALHILSPADGDSVPAPLQLTFMTDAPLHLDPMMGWVADEMHLHAMVSGTEVMPAAADIRPAGDARQWVWHLPAVTPGEHTIFLTWAGRHHGNLAGATDTVRIRVTP